MARALNTRVKAVELMIGIGKVNSFVKLGLIRKVAFSLPIFAFLMALLRQENRYLNPASETTCDHFFSTVRLLYLIKKCLQFRCLFRIQLSHPPYTTNQVLTEIRIALSILRIDSVLNAIVQDGF